MSTPFAPVIYPPVNPAPAPTATTANVTGTGTAAANPAQPAAVNVAVPTTIPTTIPYATLNIPMPIPRSEAAPHYNGKYLDDFLSRVEQHGRNAGITNKDNLVTYIFQYCSDAVKDVIRLTTEFSKDNLTPS